MLFIFRKLRRSFFLPGKVRTYLAYAVGEILLIVVGILIALQLSERNQARKDYAQESAILIRLKSEFVENQNRLKNDQNLWNQIAESMRSLLGIMGPKPDSHPDELFLEHLSFFYHIPEYNPNRGALDSLLSSGQIALIRNEELSYRLNLWIPAFNNYLSLLVEMKELRYQSVHIFSKHYQIRDLGIIVNRERGKVGPSRFSKNPKVLLSLSEFENDVEIKRANTEFMEIHMSDLITLQQTILTLIDAELAERGINVEDTTTP